MALAITAINLVSSEGHDGLSLVNRIRTPAHIGLTMEGTDLELAHVNWSFRCPNAEFEPDHGFDFYAGPSQPSFLLNVGALTQGVISLVVAHAYGRTEISHLERTVYWGAPDAALPVYDYFYDYVLCMGRTVFYCTNQAVTQTCINNAISAGDAVWRIRWVPQRAEMRRVAVAENLNALQFRALYPCA